MRQKICRTLSWLEPKKQVNLMLKSKLLSPNEKLNNLLIKYIKTNKIVVP